MVDNSIELKFVEMDVILHIVCKIYILIDKNSFKYYNDFKKYYGT